MKLNPKILKKWDKSKKNVLKKFRASIPEIIFRTTRLEGESVTREMVKSLFR